MKRLLDCGNPQPDHWQTIYRELFAEAYPDRDSCEFRFSDAANAIAHYEELAFATRNTAWDRYLAGEQAALSIAQKKGAIVFFGAGRCFVCHSDDLFSDFDYHSVGVPSQEPVILSGKDMGRYHVTGLEDDKYKFRTPPLRNVLDSEPYFHNGIEATLEGVIRQHIDPYRFAGKYNDAGDHAMTPAEIAAVSPILEEGLRVNAEEIGLLIEFLTSLSDEPDAKWMQELIPPSVPSGIDVSQFRK